uniref:Syntaxin-5 n=1 Tax=Cacopsylla melanoneura TaxID=428564 RepID=A0A8D8V3G8_9HEMI
MTTRRRRLGSESEQFSHGSIVTPQHSFIAENPSLSAGYYPDNKTNSFRSFPIEEHNMPRERTLEFNNVIRSLQGRNIVRAVAAKDVRKAQFVQNYGEFMLIAKTIGKNISSTYAKLEKLTLLAKRKSLFNDKPTEIQELTYIIKEDLNSLNQQIAKLQQVAHHQRNVISTGHQHLLSHSSSVVLALQSKLASMSTEFKNVLEVRTEVSDCALCLLSQ